MADYTSSVGGLSGLSSGIDWSTIITQLIAVEKKPVTTLQTKEATLTAQLTAIRDVNTKLVALKAAAANLADSTNVLSRATGISGGSAVTAAATSAATIGTHKVTVYKLATATTATSTSFLGNALSTSSGLADAGMGTAVSAGTFSINNHTFTIGNTAWTSGAMENSGTSGTISGNISSDSTVSFTFKGKSYTTTALSAATSGTTTLSSVASDLQTKINSALGSAGSVTVSVDTSGGTGAGKLVITGGLTDLSVDSVAGTETSGLSSLLSAGGATSKMATINSLVSDINNAGLGIVASVEKDSQGRDNLLKLYKADGSINLSTGSDTSNFLIASGLYGQNAHSAWTSGVAESATAEGKVAGSVSSDATITFSFGGTSYTTTSGKITGATADSTDLTAFASQIQSAINDKLGSTGSVTVSVDDSSGAGNGKLIVTDNKTGGSVSITSVSGTTTTGLSSLVSAGGATSGETMVSGFNLARVSTSAYLYNSKMTNTLEDALQTGIVESSTTAGKAGFSLVGSETLTLNYHGTSYTTGALAATTAGTTDLTTVASDLQSKINSALGGAGSVTVSILDSSGTNNGKLVITDNSPTNGSAMSFSVTDSPDSLKLSTTTGAQAVGTFSINGVNINYDKYHDSLSTVINRINSSSAGVTASYDSNKDKLVLTSKATGQSSISLQDVSGNFLAATYASTTGSQVLGTNATYSVDDVNNGEVMTSASNTVSSAIQGVTLHLVSVSDMNTAGTAYVPTTVSVTGDTSTAVSTARTFVTAYNDAVSDLATYTAYDSDTKTAGTLNGNAEARDLLSRLRTMISENAVGLTSTKTNLSSIGISVGADSSGDVVAAAKSTTLSLNESTFTTALEDNPSNVMDILGAFTGTPTLQSDGTGSVNSVTGRSSGQLQAGTYRIASDASGNLTAYFAVEGGTETQIGTGTITAGGTNTTLIPGLTIYAKSTLQAGTDYLKKDATTTGVLKDVESSMDEETKTGGVLESTETDIQGQIKDIEKQISDMNDTIATKQQQLTTKFTNMEVALSKLQTQGTWLTQQVTAISANWMSASLK